jgi:hypothetical protein
VELGEVAVGLEDVEEVESELDGLLVVVPESPGYCSEQCLVIEHDLHVLVAETQVEQTLGASDFVFDLLLVEQLDVVVEQFDVHLAEVDLLGSL